MEIDNLNDLPDWDDHEFEDDDEGEGWKPNPTKEACKAMYNAVEFGYDRITGSI